MMMMMMKIIIIIIIIIINHRCHAYYNEKCSYPVQKRDKSN